MKLLVATTNRGKLGEIRSLLGDLPVELLTLDSCPGVVAPEETGRTFEENAGLKALYYAAVSGLMVVAEDSGLEVDALDGAPGVESARLGGTDAPYPDKFAIIYDRIHARGAPGSTARFVCALAVAEGSSILFEARGIVEGEIAKAPRGEGGFGYDPIFYYPPFGCTLAEAGGRKSEVSHRARAFAAFRQWLAGRAE